MDISLPEDKIKYLEGQNHSLQYQLANRSEINASITERYEEMKEALHSMNDKLEKEKKLTLHLTRDMTRQYKGMQDELLNKINKRDNMIQNLTDELQKERDENIRSLKDKDETIEERDEHIKSLEAKMEELCALFAKMLEDASETMKERIEIQSACYNETTVPIQHRMEEFKFNSTISSS